MTTNRQNSRRNSFSYDFRARKKPISKVIKGLPVDYKDVDVLISYVSDRAKISSAYRVGNDAKDHRSLTTAIKRARYMALLPISHDHELVRNFIEESTYKIISKNIYGGEINIRTNIDLEYLDSNYEIFAKNDEILIKAANQIGKYLS